MSEDAKDVIGFTILFSILLAVLWFGIGSFIADSPDISTWGREMRAMVVVLWLSSNVGAAYAICEDVCP